MTAMLVRQGRHDDAVRPDALRASGRQLCPCPPAYPAALWDRLGELGLLTPGSRALDLGAGTGQATGPLRAAGLEVVAVEPGSQLAQRLRDQHPGVEVIESRAEEVELEPMAYDLAVVATAIHWMDTDLLAPKVHRALQSDGRLAVWRNIFGDPEAPVTPFRQRVQEILAQTERPPRPGAGDPEHYRSWLLVLRPR